MITIVDYGLGNVRAFENVYRRLGIKTNLAASSQELEKAKKIILPGVGAFDWALSKLENSGMVQTLNKLVLEEKIPVLGVCVGMQIMAKSSEEGLLDGLNWINAVVRKFDPKQNNKKFPLPHMGWNKVTATRYCPLFSDIHDPSFYFLHSFAVFPEQEKATTSVADYGGNFTSSMNIENIYATQFHPEKSHDFGMKLLKNFSEKC